MLLPRVKIVSGGQTGVDRGALDAALAAGSPCGGWCPAGRRAEDGPIATKYPLNETASEQYRVRTRQNVIDSDATLVIYFGALEGGTACTVEYCRELRKPCYALDGEYYAPAQAARLIAQFIAEHAIATLNVAGPRASKQAQAQRYTQAALALVLNPESLPMHDMP
jgi:predicted Rossmann fold nucleotide-binding protein DprA/Smf involved in DNA uptake